MPIARRSKPGIPRNALAFAPGAVGRRFGELSFAEQRLVLIARALVRDPELLVLDEPCHGLDADNRARVLSAVNRAAWTRGTSIIFVTHQADELPHASRTCSNFETDAS